MKTIIKVVLNLIGGAFIALIAGTIGTLFGMCIIPAFCIETGTTMTFENAEKEPGKKLYFDPKNNVCEVLDN